MKKDNIKGIVVKVTEDMIVIMTNDGSFKNIGFDSYKGQIPLIGQEITHTVRKQKSFPYRYFIPFASLILLSIIGYTFFKQENIINPAYIVAIDINPSIELMVDNTLQVIDGKGLNEDGKELLESVELNESLSDVLEVVIEESENQGYITKDKEFNIETSVIDLIENDDDVSNEIDNNLNTILQNKQLPLTYSVTSEDKEIYEEAKKENVSVNLYKHAKILEAKGIITDLNEARTKTIAELKKMERKNEENSSENKNNQKTPKVDLDENKLDQKTPKDSNQNQDEENPKTKQGNDEKGNGQENRNLNQSNSQNNSNQDRENKSMELPAVNPNPNSNSGSKKTTNQLNEKKDDPPSNQPNSNKGNQQNNSNQGKGNGEEKRP